MLLIDSEKMDIVLMDEDVDYIFCLTEKSPLEAVVAFSFVRILSHRLWKLTAC